MEPVLTVVVPAYNMQACLAQNLSAYLGEAQSGLLEVLVMDNSSTDRTPEIARSFVQQAPGLFQLVVKPNHGYGSSVNLGIDMARGRYLRIVDADDWVDPQALHQLLLHLQGCTADVVQTNYTLFSEADGSRQPVDVLCGQWQAGRIYRSGGQFPPQPPKLHSTTLRVEFLRQNSIRLLEDAFYVDEQLMLLAYINAQTMVFWPEAVYCYRVGCDGQSTSAVSLGIHYRDREQVITAYLQRYHSQLRQNTLRNPCPDTLANHVGNYFTTLYMYVKPPREGRRAARAWRRKIMELDASSYQKVRGKRLLLLCMNLCHLSPEGYQALKDRLFKRNDRQQAG